MEFLQRIIINDIDNQEGDRMKSEFKHIERWLYTEVNGQKRFKNGVDVGCGTDRASDLIVSIDQQGDPRFAHAQFVWDCKDLELFNDGKLDFILSSHVLEDFEDIPGVFLSWWKKLKIDGLMVLLLPDMEGGRYPKCSDPKGNPSHRTDTGKKYVYGMLQTLLEKSSIKYEIMQEDTIPHTESCSIDFVIRKIK